MTINVTKTVSPDLFVENESLVFDRRQALQYTSMIPSLGAVTFVAPQTNMLGGLAELAIACGNEATALIKNMIPGSPGFWLFVSEKYEAPTTQNARIREHQITKYRMVWNEHLQPIVSTPIMNAKREVVIESGSFVFLTGLLDVYDSIPEAINAVRTHPAYSMIVSRRPELGSPESIFSIFSSSFPQEDDIKQMRVNWLSLAVELCSSGDMLLRVSGLFDDHEAAVDIIGTTETILRL